MYCGVALYEQEEKAIQNRIEDWWISLDNVGARALAAHASFTKRFAIGLDIVLKKLFGSKPVSMHGIGACFCLFAFSSNSLDWLSSMMLFQCQEKSEIIFHLSALRWSVAFGVLLFISSFLKTKRELYVWLVSVIIFFGVYIEQFNGVGIQTANDVKFILFALGEAFVIDSIFCLAFDYLASNYSIWKCMVVTVGLEPLRNVILTD